MKTIVRTLFGSNLYGTATPTSDTDFKSIHLPSREAMLLHEPQNVVSRRTKEDRSQKNTAEDIDDESFALHRWLKMIEGGDSIALELLHAPDRHLLVATSEWRFIHENRDRLLTRNCTGFIAYCQRQAAKYGVKGSRMSTVRGALDQVEAWIRTDGDNVRLGERDRDIDEFIADHEHTSIVPIPHPSGKDQLHWEICDRKFPYTGRLGETRRVLKQVFDNYGARTRAAEANDGVDWKAMSHAVRVGRQAIELLSTGTLTFPRPEAAHLLRIKRGEFHYKAVAEELEDLLDEVKAAAAASTLPEAIDTEFARELTLDLYRKQICGEACA